MLHEAWCDDNSDNTDDASYVITTVTTDNNTITHDHVCCLIDYNKLTN